MVAVCKSNDGYYIPMSVFVALVLDIQFETARFQCVKYKALRTRVYALVLYKNAFPIYRSPSSNRPTRERGFGMKTPQRYKLFLNPNHFMQKRT